MSLLRAPRRAVVASVVAVLAALGSGQPAGARAPTAPDAVGEYLAVIDAGSSGSRLTLFRSPAAPGASAVQAFAATRVRPGLSSFAAHPARAGSSLAPMLTELEAFTSNAGIPASAVPVAVLATAGLRNVEAHDPDAARAILDSARHAVKAAGFPVHDARVLTGDDEAAFAWLDANATRGTLTDPRRSVGIVEIGGASAQVAFRVHAGTSGAVPLDVGGHVVHVMAESFLGLGANDARDRTFSAGHAPACLPNNTAGVDPATFDAGQGRSVPGAAASFRPVVCQRAFAATVRDARPSAAFGAMSLPDLARVDGFERARFIGVAVAAYAFQDFDIADTVDEDAAMRQVLRTTCTGPDAWHGVQVLVGASGDQAVVACANGAFVRQFVFGAQGLSMNPARFSVPAGGAPSWPAGYATAALSSDAG